MTEEIVNSDSSEPYLLSLKDIAAWQLPFLGKPPIVARIPSLQRGAVWEPAQIEMLWDSILRGFPIGSLVACKRLKGQGLQGSQVAKAGKGATEETVTHHLLDGQQRGNAIAFGFADPFDEEQSSGTGILWLDLDPELSGDSTRNFLVRFITESHPWGFKKDDAASRLEASKVRKALQAYGWRDREDEFKILRKGRPRPSQAWPFEAVAPVPLAWLLADMQIVTSDADFWKKIKSRLDGRSAQPWAQNAQRVLLDDNSTQLRRIYRGLQFALQLKLAVLIVPHEAILSASEQEKAAKDPAGTPVEDISNVEHLFHRLNRNGTRLDGEDLAYSMIKAYLPKLESPVAAISTKEYMPATPTRLVALGTRAALAGPRDKGEFPGKRGVSALRTIAGAKDPTNEKHYTEKEEILRFFGETDEHELGKVCHLIDHWLVFGRSKLMPHDFRLPCILRTSIAQNSPDIYLFLMLIARRVLAENKGFLSGAKDATDELRRQIVALATALHWFGTDKARVVGHLYKECCYRSGTLTKDSFKGMLADCYNLKPNNSRSLIPLVPPNKLKEVLTLPSIEDAAFKDWQWWELTKRDGQEDATLARDLWPFLDRIRNERELLLYAQRCFITNRFSDYDPSRQDLWRSHNRPWDYDHILAWAHLYHNKNGVYRDVCRQWLNCIGNLRAWPFEDNRSDQKDSATKKISDAELADSLVKDDKERTAFSVSGNDFDSSHKAGAFIAATRDRLLRIYECWYDTLEIGFLTNEAISEGESCANTELPDGSDDYDSE